MRKYKFTISLGIIGLGFGFLVESIIKEKIRKGQ